MGCFPRRGSNPKGNRGCCPGEGMAGAARAAPGPRAALPAAAGCHTMGVMFSLRGSLGCTVVAAVLLVGLSSPAEADRIGADGGVAGGGVHAGGGVDVSGGVHTGGGAGGVAVGGGVDSGVAVGGGLLGGGSPGGGVLGGGVAVGAGVAVGLPGPGWPRLRTRVWLARTGGFVGADDRITIERNGAWTHRDLRFGRTRTGQLTRSQIMRLGGLLDAARGFHPGRPKPGCADAFRFTLVAGGYRASYEDCNAQGGPVADAVQFILRAVAR